MRELNDFCHLESFYKQYYAKEIESAEQREGRKLPIKKRGLIFQAREHNFDKFCNECLLHPRKLAENYAEKKRVNEPPQPTVNPLEMAKTYVTSPDLDTVKVLENICKYYID